MSLEVIGKTLFGSAGKGVVGEEYQSFFDKTDKFTLTTDNSSQCQFVDDTVEKFDSAFGGLTGEWIAEFPHQGVVYHVDYETQNDATDPEGEVRINGNTVLSLNLNGSDTSVEESGQYIVGFYQADGNTLYAFGAGWNFQGSNDAEIQTTTVSSITNSSVYFTSGGGDGTALEQNGRGATLLEARFIR